MLRIGGRSYATGAIPVAQRVVERVFSFHHLFAGKSKWNIRVGNKLRDMHHLYMGLVHPEHLRNARLNKSKRRWFSFRKIL